VHGRTARAPVLEAPVLDIHRRTGYLLLATLVGQIILISAQVNTTSGTRVLRAVTFGIFSQVQLGAARVLGGVQMIWGGYIGLRGAHAENQQLRDELMATRVRLQEQQALALRGAELELLLGLSRRTSLRTLAANVVASRTDLLFKTLTIDQGSSAGLRKDMAVIASAGVVGRIVEQPPLYAAKVQLLIDRQAGAGAMIERSGAGGVVVGHDGDQPLRMDYVSNLADVKKGDRVLTSGIDGIYPRGFPIGTVERVERGVGLYKEIWLRPVVDFSSLGAVLVVLEPSASPAAEAAK
jgi:rod shape-determining protein MreC